MVSKEGPGVSNLNVRIVERSKLGGGYLSHLKWPEVQMPSLR